MKKKGFTLIELLAVIIILGILMLVAIPSVTAYINNSRKNTYASSIQGLIKGAINKVNSGEIEVGNEDTTYYIPYTCISTDNALSSPYGSIEEAYIAVVHEGDGFAYYFAGRDSANIGVSRLIKSDKISSDKIKEGVTAIDNTIGVDDKSKVVVFNADCSSASAPQASSMNVNGSTGKIIRDYVCMKATTLKKELCSRDSGGCAANHTTGQYVEYGTIPDGEPKVGDAYDCKVTANGDYSERFYYIGGDSTVSYLLYYKNYNSTKYKYDTVNENWHGPRAAVEGLPTTSEWNNPGLLSNDGREILNNLGTNTTDNGNHTIDAFTGYVGKAARLLSYNDIVTPCKKSNLDYSYTSAFDACEFLFEETSFASSDSSRPYGYWLETPIATTGTGPMLTSSQGRYITYYSASNAAAYSARPVIKIYTSKLEINDEE